VETFIKMVSNVGFPIAITGFLLLRFEKKIDRLNETITNILELFLKPSIKKE